MTFISPILEEVRRRKNNEYFYWYTDHRRRLMLPIGKDYAQHISVLLNWMEMGGEYIREDNKRIQTWPRTITYLFTDEKCKDVNAFLDYIENVIVKKIEKDYESDLEQFHCDEYVFQRRHFGVRGDKDTPQSGLWVEAVSDYEDNYKRAFFNLGTSERWSIEVLSQHDKVFSITRRRITPIMIKVMCRNVDTDEKFRVYLSYTSYRKTFEEFIRNYFKIFRSKFVDVDKDKRDEYEPDQIWRAELSVAGDDIYKVIKLEKESQKPITTIWSLYDEMGK